MIVLNVEPHRIKSTVEKALEKYRALEEKSVAKYFADKETQIAAYIATDLMNQRKSFRCRYLPWFFKPKALTERDIQRSMHPSKRISYLLRQVLPRMHVGEYHNAVQKCEELLVIINKANYRDARISISEEVLVIINGDAKGDPDRKWKNPW